MMIRVGRDRQLTKSEEDEEQRKMELAVKKKTTCVRSISPCYVAHRHFFAFGSSVSQRCRPSCLPKNPRGRASLCHPPWTDLSPPICSSSGKSQPTREVSPAATQPNPNPLESLRHEGLLFGVSLCVGQGGSPCPRPASWLPLIPASILVPGLYQMMDFEKAESEEMAAPPVQLRGGRGGREGGRTKEPHRQAGVSIAPPQKKEGGETAVASSGGGRWEG